MTPSYLTVINDLDRSRVLYVAPGRGKASLDGFWPTLTKEQREVIRSVSIDMWAPYIASIKFSPALWADPRRMK